ncbi:hypothetical protein RhiirA1_543268 [Rhizophagus irregularis]|uniref:Uncharacterized protein n=1 Tax=Rhizophagus irregularis TaxID=588596 RepID=A0A2N0QQ87_9GLOM|nr:hypothetical protein RhiirA1_543268 [Rhizophagus irregularis]
MVRKTRSKSYSSNKTNNTTSKNKITHKRQRTSNSTIEESTGKKKGNSSNPSGESFDADDARKDLLDDLLVVPLDEFNTPHNSTSFNNESLEESDKSPIKKSNSNVTDKSEKRLLHYKPNINSRAGLSENNTDTISTGDPASHNKNSEYYIYKRTDDNTSPNTSSDEDTTTRDNFQDEPLSDGPSNNSDMSVKDSNKHKPKYTLCYTPENTDNSRGQEAAPQPRTAGQDLSSRHFINLDPSINHATSDMVNETKIMFLRARNPPPAAYMELAKSVAPGYTETSKTISFLKTKINAYYADHRSRLNSGARAYGEEYIDINGITLENMPNVESLGSFVNDTVIYQCLKNPFAQVSDEWWDNDKDAVNAFRLLIAKCIKIHMINILKCIDEPLLTNASALNEVKTLDYITRDLTLPHHNQTNFANEINFNALEASTSYRNGRGRGRGRGRFYGRGRGGFGRRH